MSKEENYSTKFETKQLCRDVSKLWAFSHHAQQHDEIG